MTLLSQVKVPALVRQTSMPKLVVKLHVNMQSKKIWALLGYELHSKLAAI